MKPIARYVLFIAALAAFGVPLRVTAQSCGPFLKNINNWFVTQPQGPGTYEILATQAGNNSAGNLANYVEGPSGEPGVLTYHPKALGSLDPPYLEGTLVQYFSARRYDPTNTGLIPWAPFNPFQVDNVGITIYLGSSPAPPLGSGVKLGQVTYTLYAFGNLQLTMQGLCQDGLLYGFVGNSLQVMSLNEHFTQVPK